MYKQLHKIIDHCENKTNNHAISVPLFILFTSTLFVTLHDS